VPARDRGGGQCRKFGTNRRTVDWRVVNEPTWATSPLTLPSALACEIIAHARAGVPNEVCGVLAHVAGVVTATYPVTNVEPDPRRYVMDAKGLFTATRNIEQRGWELLGFYHSHPSSPPIPSETDLANAYYPGHCYAIVSLSDPARPEIRFYFFQDGRFAPLAVG
jgi:proteasome lid subunit RPN8/RPN11